MTEIQKQALRVMRSLPSVVFSTLDAEGAPDLRAMLNLRNPQLFPQFESEYDAEPNPLTVYLTTNLASSKMAQIAADPRAGLCFCDPGSFLGVMLQGQVEVISDSAFRHRVWREDWNDYYPGGVDSDDFVLLRFVPKRVKYYDGNLNTSAEEL